MNTLSDLFLSAADRYASRTAVIEGGKSVTYNELAQMAAGFASFLSSRGIGKGDRVAVFLPNSIEFIAAIFGIALSGSVSVPINSTFKEEEVGFSAFYDFNYVHLLPLVSR